MAINPKTGGVICMVGGKDFRKSQFNRCTQAIRQPGSAFKPIIYAAALDKGYTESSLLIDSPVSFKDGGIPGRWSPKNYDRKFWGPIPLRKALVHSRNVVSVKLLSDIGVSYAIDYARRLGVSSPLVPELSLALGSSDVTLAELVTAYSSFANAGRKVEPYLIERITDRKGKLLERHHVNAEQVISAQTAYIMTDLLSAVVEEGTAKGAKTLERPAAGKTGTTNEMKDAWFVGYTPTVLAGVWVGNDNHQVPLGDGETGGRAACPIWVHFMQEYLKDSPVEAFKIPSGIVMAKMNPRSGSISSSEAPGGTYAAFAGAPPNQHVRGPRTGDSVPSSKIASSSTESFFKSDLF
jgi:penicillin-binding protein 1A